MHLMQIGKYGNLGRRNCGHFWELPVGVQGTFVIEQILGALGCFARMLSSKIEENEETMQKQMERR